MNGGRLLPPEDENGLDEAERTESKRYHRLLFAFYLIALLIPFGAAVLALRTGHDLVAAIAALVAVFPLAHAGGVTSQNDRRVVIRQLRLFLGAFVTAGMVALALWPVTGALDEDVTDSSKLSDSTHLGTGATAELRVAADPGSHDELHVTLTVSDDEGGRSPCITLGRLEFTGPDLAESVTAPMDDAEVSAILPLQATGPVVTVDVDLTTRRGCRLTLGREEVSYR